MKTLYNNELYIAQFEDCAKRFCFSPYKDKCSRVCSRWDVSCANNVYMKEVAKILYDDVQNIIDYYAKTRELRALNLICLISDSVSKDITNKIYKLYEEDRNNNH